MTRTAVVGRALALAALLLAPTRLLAQEASEPCTPKPGKEVVEGTVLDSTTAIPLEGAGVVVSWQPDPRRDYRDDEDGETDHEGRFRICDVPGGRALTIQAGFWGQRSGEHDVVVGDTPPAALVLLVDAPHSTLEGHVVDAQSNQPVEGASVRLEGIAEARVTSPDGAFHFGRVPPKSYAVEVSHLAFATVADTLDVDVASGVDATIRMAPGVIPLEPITVVVRSLVLDRAGFYERQGRNNGHFVTRQQVDAEHPLQSSEILRRIPNIRLQRGREGLIAVGRSNCPFRYVIDGVRTGPDFSIDLISTGDIEGLEVYLGPSQVPGEFTGLSSDLGGTCGVIIVWTRRHVKF